MTRNSILHLSWEFITTLDYEWDVIRGHRPYRWTIWVCDFGRFFWISSSGVGTRGLTTHTNL
jgi:hypothetical protein